MECRLQRHSAEFVVRHGTKWSAVFSATPLRCVAHYKQAPLRFATWRTTNRVRSQARNEVECRLQRHSASLRGALQASATPLRYVAHYKQAPLRFATWRTTNRVRSQARNEVECRLQRHSAEFVVRHGTKWSAVFSATPLRCVAHYKQAPLRFATWRTTNRVRSQARNEVECRLQRHSAEFVVRHERSGVPLRFSAHSAAPFVVRHGTKWSAVLSATPLRCVAHYKQAPLRFATWRTTNRVRSQARNEVECRLQRHSAEFVVRHGTKWSAVFSATPQSS